MVVWGSYGCAETAEESGKYFIMDKRLTLQRVTNRRTGNDDKTRRYFHPRVGIITRANVTSNTAPNAQKIYKAKEWTKLRKKLCVYPVEHKTFSNVVTEK